MARGVYKEITFEENYPRTFDQFKAEFENTHVFRGIEPKKRLKELKIAFEIATGKTSKKEDVVEEE